jgi:RbcX protein
MDIKAVANSSASALTSYLTYQAMLTVLNQLSETNPPLALWLHSFSGKSVLQNGELYLQSLMTVNQELALRIMTVREHIAEEVLDELPEMVRHRIAQQNMEHRRQQLEKLSQLPYSPNESDASF